MMVRILQGSDSHARGVSCYVGKLGFQAQVGKIAWSDCRRKIGFQYPGARTELILKTQAL